MDSSDAGAPAVENPEQPVFGTPVEDETAAPEPVVPSAPPAPEEEDTGLYPEVSAAGAAGVATPPPPPVAPAVARAGETKGSEDRKGGAAAAGGSSDGDESRFTALVLWRDPKVSGAVFAALFAAIYLGTFALAEWALLLALLGAGCMRGYLMYKGEASAATFSIPVSRADVDRATQLVGDAVWSVLDALNAVLAWRSIETSLRALAYVWLVFAFSGLSYMLHSPTLQMTVLIGMFTVPLALEKFGDVAATAAAPHVTLLRQKSGEVQTAATEKFAQVTAAVPSQALNGGAAVLVAILAWFAPSATVTTAALIVALFNLVTLLNRTFGAAGTASSGKAHAE